MTNRRLQQAWLATLAAGLGALLTPRIALAEPAPPTTEFSLGVGYAHISIGDDGPFEGEDAWKFDPSLSIAPIPGVPQLRLGAAVGWTFVVDNSNRAIVSNNGQLTIAASGDIPLWLFEPELRLSWRQHLGDPEGLFIEPGVAAGWTYAYVDVEDDAGNSYDASDSTFSTRVFLRVGSWVPSGFAGIEAAWMRGDDLNLADNVQGDVEEFYIGIFGALAF